MHNLGKAYVQIVPSAKGISSGISDIVLPEADSAGEEAGRSMGDKLATALKATLIAAGIGKVIASSISEGAALQQSFGGLDTIYGKASEAAKQYARDAAKVGLSSNEYAEQAVAFGASLKQAFGGDVQKAAESANTAIMDMTDNAAKMGTPIESLQNAYQGFAKQNYTMLDNLKLGYGGTKSEMERLLRDAEKLPAALGKKFDINNLGDVYEALHLIQGDLGLTGVAADEARTTFSGSFEAMKASAKNLLGSLSLGDDITDEVSTLAETVKTFVVDNFLPMVGNIFKSIPDIVTQAIPLIGDAAGELMQWFSENITSKAPELLETAGVVIQSFLDGITEKLPDLLDKGVEMIKNLADGAFQNMPAVITAIGDILNSFIEFIVTNLPTILEKGAELITFLADGISQNMPYILSAIGQVLMNLLQTIINHLPQILSAGVKLIVALVRGMLQILGSVRSAAGNIAQSALSKLLGFVGQMLSAGVRWISSVISGLISGAGRLASSAGSIARQALNSFLSTNWVSVGSHIISGIVSGLWGAAGSLFSSLRNMASNALQAAKSALHIGSPSKLFRDEVGKWIPEGIAVGIDMNADAVDDAVAELANPSAFNMQTYSPAPASAQSNQTMPNMTINVYPSEGMDERKLADYVAQSIYKEVRRRGVAFA